jgi:hypothetical protein
MVTSSTIVGCDTANPDHSLESSDYSAETISLHVLCTSCTRFCDGSEVLSCIQRSKSPSIDIWPLSELCTVEHLIRHSKSCHLCKFLLAAIQDSYGYKKDQWKQFKVYLRPGIHEPPGTSFVGMSIADAISADGSKEFSIGTFDLKKYDC